MLLTLSPLIPALAGAAVVVVFLFLAFKNYQHKRLIDDLPTSKVQGVFLGLTELKGTAESESPFNSFLSGMACVQYLWQVEEHWSRTVTETYRDAKGNMQTRTRTESGWTKVDSGGESAPFYLKDETGIILVVPEGASITGSVTFNQTLGRDSQIYFDKGPAREIANSTHQRRFHETAIPLHTPLYILGQARERQDIVAAEIARDKNAPLFLISIRSEKQISRGYGLWFWCFAILALLAGMGSVAVWSWIQGSGSISGSRPYWIVGGGLILVFLIGWIWTVYNSLIGLKHRVGQAWSQVDIELKRRNDLIPNLVGSVESYRNYESQTQALLVEIRGQLSATPPGVTGPDFKGITPVLRTVVEQYPELKAAESFLKLQKSLAETEQRIALARDYFNQITTFFNTRRCIIPDRFVGTMAGLREQTLMGASDFERAPVKVNLASDVFIAGSPA